MNDKVTVVKEFSFEAAHYLPNYKGACANMHGHHYILQIGVRGPVGVETGMVVDFSELKRLVTEEIVDNLDHQLLNDVGVGFETVTLNTFPCPLPTAENMVLWIVRKLQSKWDYAYIDKELVLVRLYETPTSYAEWHI